jgi:hypothetical protein
MNQPLIEVIARTEKRINKKGEIEKNDIKVFLIPEFVSLTGMTDDQRNDYKTMNKVAETTKLTPNQRLDATAKIIQEINGDEF